MTIRAIYEKGVFRPTEPVNLPEHAEVEFDPKIMLDEEADRAAQQRIYELMSESFESGESDVAERHNEHSSENVI